jgi:hypothetical protein
VAPASLERNRRAAIENIIDNDPVAAVVREIMTDRAQWRGSASDLLQIGVPGLAGQRAPGHSLAGCAGAETFLRTLGIEIVFGRSGRLGTRTIRITAVGETESHDTVSRVSDNSGGHGADLIPILSKSDSLGIPKSAAK